jgi:hypothetical protein
MVIPTEAIPTAATLPSTGMAIEPDITALAATANINTE